MPKKCVINLDTLATIKKSTLEKRITFLSDEKITLVDRALKFALAIP
jgi:mRNA-degrading endonuclease toxin of MazEF toxin-antitoxin module